MTLIEALHLGAIPAESEGPCCSEGVCPCAGRSAAVGRQSDLLTVWVAHHGVAKAGVAARMQALTTIAGGTLQGWEHV